MNRRHYLTTGFGLATVAITGTTTAQADEADLERHDHELIVENDDISDEVYVEAIVENVGDGPSGRVDLEVDWYDDEGNYLGNDREWLYTFPPGETWEARIYALGDAADIADYDLETDFDATVDALDPDGLSAVDSEMQVGDRAVEIAGQIENETGETADYIQAIATISDDEDTILGDDRTNETDVPAGETWAFEISWRGRDRVDRADDHEIRITDAPM